MNGPKWQIAISVVNVVAVPLTAFVIRMAKGDTRSESEVVISEWVQSIIRKIKTEVTQ